MSKTQPLYPNCDFSIWFRSVDETSIAETPIQGRKTGTIPEWIEGCFYQNGPGLLNVTGKRVQHLFDAFGLIQKFTIKNGNVTYQSRILQSNAYQKAKRTGELQYTEYGTARAEGNASVINEKSRFASNFTSFFSRIQNIFNSKSDYRTDNAMISIYPYRISTNKVALFAMTETPIMHEIDSQTIETRSKFDVSNYLPIFTHCAHAIILQNRAIINVGLASSLTGMNYVIFEFPGPSNLNTEENLMTKCKVLGKIPSHWPLNPSYMHTFAVTENYIILVEQSLRISLVEMIQVALAAGPLTDALIWHEKEPTRFRIINRRTMTELNDYKYLTAPFFFLHIINAYEDAHHLIMDICCYDNSDMLDCMKIEALENAQENPNYYKQFRGRPKRFVMPLTVDKSNENQIHLNYTTCQAKLISKRKLWIEPELIVDVGCELPQIDYFRCNGKFYRYFYAINSDIDYEHCGAIRKIDIHSKTCQIWYETGCYTSEAIFLRNPFSETGDEDDGVLVMSLLRADCENEVSLVVLDARSMTEIGRVQFSTSGPVPKCLHGLWMDARIE